MLGNPSLIAGTVALCVICAFAFCYGCSGERSRLSAVRANDEMLLRVVEQVFDGEWKNAGEILVKRDGSYKRTIHNLSKLNSVSTTVEGHLPHLLMRDLREDVLQKKGFEVIEDVPTYQYGIDNHHVRHPSGIGQLLNFITEKDEEKERGNQN